MKIMLGDFNTELRTEDICKLTFWNEGLHQDSKDNGVRIVNFAAPKLSYVHLDLS